VGLPAADQETVPKEERNPIITWEKKKKKIITSARETVNVT